MVVQIIMPQERTREEGQTTEDRNKHRGHQQDGADLNRPGSGYALDDEEYEPRSSLKHEEYAPDSFPAPGRDERGDEHEIGSERNSAPVPSCGSSSRDDDELLGHPRGRHAASPRARSMTVMLRNKPCGHRDTSSSM